MLARSSLLLSKFAATVMAVGLVGWASAPGFAQNNNGNVGLITNRVVGGVSVDANGVLTGQSQKLAPELKQQLADGLRQVDDDIQRAGLRMVSLKGLENALNQAAANGQPVPADVEFLAGLQRIEFVIVDPDQHDVILAGPAEGWKVNDDGLVVGEKSGLPVLKLEDLLVALRSANAARQGDGISVSIDPTEEGVKRLAQFYQSIPGFNPDLANQVESAMGQHQIRLTGVPADSRYGQILVAADYKMKRLSMGLEAAPIDDFPSILEMAQKKDANHIGNMAPRFWMECNYEPIARNQEGTIWQIRGQGVKTMTEEQFVDRNGQFKKADKPNKFAQQWAETMTRRFEELSQAEPVFRELRNLMDMSVVAALISKEGLLDKAQIQIPCLDGSNQYVSTPSWQTPKTVPTSCSFVQTSRSWIVTASGGVLVDSWAVASQVEVSTAASTVSLTRNADRWWWNAN